VQNFGVPVFIIT